MESQVRRHGRVRGQAVEDAGRRKHEAETAPGRCDARQRRFERPFGKEVVTPPARRKAVAHLMDHHQMSERRACKAMGFCRLTIRYETRRSDDHDLRERMKELAWILSLDFGHGSGIFSEGGSTGQKLIGKFAPEIVKRPDHAKGVALNSARWVVERSFAWLESVADWPKTSRKPSLLAKRGFASQISGASRRGT